MRLLVGAAIVAFLVAAIAIAVLYTSAIQYSPLYDFDEVGFLNIPARVADYGDDHYLVLLDEGFNSQKVRKYPPVLAFAARNVIGVVTGFSPINHRLISAGFVATAVLAGVLVTIRVGGMTPLAFAPMVLAALQPSVLAAARSVRFEQEIMWFAMLAVAGLPAILRVRRPRVNLGLWMVSGAAAGMAAVSHPWGVTVPLALLAALVVYRRAWSGLDRLMSWQRLGCWLAGVAVPCAITVGGMLLDWSNYRAYSAAFLALYGGHEDFFLAHYPTLAAHLPVRLAAGLGQGLLYTDLYASHDPIANTPAPTAFVWAFTLQLALVVLFVVLQGGRATRPTDAYIYSLAFLSFGFLAFLFVYPPNTNYFLYQSLAVPLTCCVVVARWWRQAGTHRDLVWNIARVGAVAALLVSAIPTIQFARNLSFELGKPSLRERASLDTQFRTYAEMATSLGLDGNATRQYCDAIAWYACGARMGSLIELVHYGLSRQAPDTGGAIFDRPSLVGLDGIGLFASDPTGPDRRQVVTKLLSPFHLAGLVLHDGVPRQIQFWGPNGAPNAIRVALIDSDATVAWGRTSPAGRDSVRTSPITVEWQSVPQGRYVLCIRGAPRKQSSYQLTLRRNSEVLQQRPSMPLDGESYLMPECISVDVPGDVGSLVLTIPEGDDIANIGADLLRVDPEALDIR